MWAVQVGLYVGVRNQPWYKPPYNDGGETIQDQNWVSYEYSVLWKVANFQFVTSVLIFNTGPPFRAPIYYNIPFTLCLIAVTALNLVWIFKTDYNKDNIVYKWFSLLDYKKGDVTYYSFRWILFGIIIGQLIANAVIELLFVRRITKASDDRIERKKLEDFEKVMEHLNENKKD